MTGPSPVITDTASLAALCESLAATDYVTVDTEFMRERTFWPILCLVQIAGPEGAVAIDPLAEGIDLAPLFALMNDPRVLKVFHAARQDCEIFHYLSGHVPMPLFDTQIAAMVCGFGDSVSYDHLVTKLTKARIDKSHRFTDWARRPLTAKQLRYALDDVHYLRPIYERLARRLDRGGRRAWVAEEMAALTDPDLYAQRPLNAWRRLKTRSVEPRFLAILREVAAWREREAQGRDVPRNRVVRDEALLEIASHPPATVADLERLRGLGGGLARGKVGQAILAAVAEARALPDDECPRLERPAPPPRGVGPVVDLLKVLLKMKAEQHNVAHRLIANADDLLRLAGDDAADVPALHGWRREIFGADALALKSGERALVIHGKHLALIPTPRPDSPGADA